MRNGNVVAAEGSQNKTAHERKLQSKSDKNDKKVHKLFSVPPPPLPYLLHVLPNTLLVCFSIFGSTRYAFVFAAAALLLLLWFLLPLLLFLWHLTVGTRHK